MFKYIKDEYEEKWEIHYEDMVIGQIKVERFFISIYKRSTYKKLYVLDKEICEVKNQQQATEKLNDYFQRNKQDIKDLEILIDSVSNDLSKVGHEHTIKIIDKEISRLKEQLEQLKKYDLIKS